MIHQTQTFIANTVRRISASSIFVLRHVRLTAIYVAVAVLLLSGWLVSVLVTAVPPTSQTNSNSTANSQGAASGTPATDQKASIQGTTKGESMQSNSIDSPGASNEMSSSTSASVNSDSSGTSVTVNGQTDTAPPNQPFSQSYDTSSNGVTSHTDVSVDNSTAGNGSVNIQMHSSTHSTSGGSNNDDLGASTP